MRPAKLFLVLLVVCLAGGGYFAATRTRLVPAAASPIQHGLGSSSGSASQPANAPDTSAVAGQSAMSLADLTAQASSGDATAGVPFALMPVGSSPAAPDFTLTTIDGKSVKLSDAVKNGPVLLDFWAIWCGPCQMEMPELGKIYAKYKARGFQIYGINSDASTPQLKHFFRNASPGFPMLADTGGIVAQGYNVSAIPALFLIDRSGRVRSAMVGFDPNTGTDLPNSIDQLLAGQTQKI